MNDTAIRTGIRILFRAIALALLAFWLVALFLPYLRQMWNMAFWHYNHEIAILPVDVECELGGEGETGRTVTLPKGLMVYSPCRHDFSRMSLEETGTYKIYVKLTPRTINAMPKDTDEDKWGDFMRMKQYGVFEERRRDKSADQAQ